MARQTPILFEQNIGVWERRRMRRSVYRKSQGGDFRDQNWLRINTAQFDEVLLLRVGHFCKDWHTKIGHR